MAFDLTKTVAIKHSQVSGSSNISNFRFLFKSTLANLKTTGNGGVVTSSSGYDIVFTSDHEGNSQLKHEIVHYDPATGEFISWVLIPTVYHDQDTLFYLHAGNNEITTSQEDKASVWSGYAGVWHLSEESGSTRNDSSSNENQLTDSTNISQDDGKIYKSAALLRSNGDHLSRLNANLSGLKFTGSFTVSGWIKMPTLPSDAGVSVMTLFSRWLSTENNRSYRAFLHFDTDGGVADKLFVQYSNNGQSSSLTSFVSDDPYLIENDLDEWIRFAISVDVGNKTAIVLKNDSLINTTKGQDDATSVFAGAADFSLGGRQGASDLFNGNMEHVTIVPSLLSSDVLITEYRNQNNPGSFYQIINEYSTPGALAFGEQNPTNGEIPLSWSTWIDGEGGEVSVVGDPDWGKLSIGLDDEGRSQVYDLQSGYKMFTVTLNKYGTGDEDGTVYIRGSQDYFSDMDETVQWEEYSGQINRDWRYVQVRVVYSS